jgi:hypothetical protein
MMDTQGSTPSYGYSGSTCPRCGGFIYGGGLHACNAQPANGIAGQITFTNYDQLIVSKLEEIRVLLEKLLSK